MFDLAKKYQWILVSGIFAVAFILTLANYLVKPKIATVNINAIMTHYVQKQAKLNADSVYLQEATKKFVHQLEKEIKILADKNGSILFVSEAILAGAHDYTPELEQKVYQALRTVK